MQGWLCRYFTLHIELCIIDMQCQVVFVERILQLQETIFLVSLFFILLSLWGDYHFAIYVCLVVTINENNK